MILAAVNLYSLLRYLVLAISGKVGNRPFTALIGVRLCGIVDMNFVEDPFHTLR